eukprot:254073-Hanusia_phi.AAC.1
MACTTFGVCTSLGFGVMTMVNGLRRIDCGGGIDCVSNIPPNDGSHNAKVWQVSTIWIITLIATISVVTGLNHGIKALSLIAFGLGNLLL